jgi:hypothetical protein
MAKTVNATHRLQRQADKRDVALALRRFHGFPRYFDRADNFSATANKYFKKNSCCRHRNTRRIRCAIRSRID